MNRSRNRSLHARGAWLAAILFLCAGCPPVSENGSPSLRFAVDSTLVEAEAGALLVELLGDELPDGVKQTVDGDSADLTLVQTGEQWSLVDTTGRTRSRYAMDETPETAAELIRRDLSGHVMQRRLLQRWEDASPESSPLKLQFLQDDLAPSHEFDCVRAVWDPQPANRHQPLPLCMPWALEIELSPERKEPLYVAGWLLAADGSIETLRPDGTPLRLDPGSPNLLVQGTAVPPLESEEWILLYGLPDEQAVTGSTSDLSSSAEWTLGALSYSVIGNSPFLPAQQAGGPPKSREYTIPRFDIRPYLPARTDSALFRLLVTAHGLFRYHAEIGDGVPYKQHEWAEGSDVANLALGIDCSRSIWYAFTRSGLGYTDDKRMNGYLPTAWMIGDDSPMTQHFNSCNADPNPRIGDVLVYRDAARNVGHTVVVIDAEKRIAWGSHGWDGVLEEGYEADTGVEYQLIRKKREWMAWDRSSMERKACWRHEALIAEADDPGAQPGTYQLDADDACSSRCDELGTLPGE